MKTKRSKLKDGCLRASLLALVLSMAICPRPALGGIIGYVNVGFTNGYNFIANPLMSVTNTLNAVMRGSIPPVPDGCAVYLWNPTNQAFSVPSIYSASGDSWSPDYEVLPGNGFVVQSPAVWTNTFVGEVIQGTNRVPIFGSNKLSLVACVHPLAVDLANVISQNWSQFPQVDGANAYIFKSESQHYSDAFTCFTGFGWYDPGGTVGTNGPTIRVAQSFFVRNPGPDTNWLTTFQIDPPPAAQTSQILDESTVVPKIIGIRIQAGIVTLRVTEADADYNVEWSSDGVHWTTLASDQKGEVWNGPLPPGLQGYFRLTQP